MNAPKFTPGPWEIVIRKVGPDEIRSADGSAELICEFPYGAGAGVDIQDVANANLVKAAPELYEALAELSRYFIGEWERDERGQDEVDAGREAAEKRARAALAKAVQS